MNIGVLRNWFLALSGLIVLFFGIVYEYFTMTATKGESEPLIAKKTITYSAVTHDLKLTSSDNHQDNGFRLSDFKQLDGNGTNDKGTNGKDTNGKGTNGYGTNNGVSNLAYQESGNGEPHAPPGGHGVVIGTDRISYTWHDMNVFTTVVDSRRRGWWWNRREMGTGLRKQIIKNVSGAAHPGELLAIMGSSGAGKTTLLNTLMFRSPSSVAVSGQRLLNGIPVASSELASLSGYVQQDDLFIGTLTVKEHLIFHALVRMDRGIPYKQRMLRVDQVISELALTKCQDTIIGIPGRIKGISGGEMKRLSFASEVLTDPPLMFCDEPTSGLDSFMAQNVVSVMKTMALKGKTVVSTIHQPSSELFAMFDKVLLMAEGRVAFLGTTTEACAFFNDLGAPCPRNYNPADYFVQLLAVVPAREDSCRQTIEMVCDAFDRSDAGVKLAAETELLPEIQAKLALNGGGLWGDEYFQLGGGDRTSRSPYKASWWAQFRAVLWRSWLSVIKEPILIKVRILQTVMVAVLIGVIYFGQQIDQEGVMNINGALFVFLTNMTFQNVFAVTNVFCSELPVFMREHFNGTYRVDVYFLCKTIAEVPLFVFIPVIYTAITYYLIGLNPDIARFAIAVGVVVLVSNVAISFGYFISCISSSVAMATSIGPPLIIPMLLFGGFFLNVGSVPVYLQWLSYLSWFKWGNEALLINQWGGVDEIACTDLNSTCPKNGHVVLETLNFNESHFAMDIWSLVALIVGFRLVAFLALLSKTFRKE